MGEMRAISIVAGRLRRIILAFIVALTAQMPAMAFADFDPTLDITVEEAEDDGDLDRAARLIEDALGDEDDQRIREDLLTRLGAVLDKAGKPREAAGAYSRLAETAGARQGASAPGLVTIFDRAAAQYAEAGLDEEAADALARILEILRSAGLGAQAGPYIERLKTIAGRTADAELKDAIAQAVGDHDAALADLERRKTEGKRAFEANPDKGFTTVKIYYATDRARTGASLPSDFYGGSRGTDVEYGAAKVSIPNRHKPGRVEKPSIWTFDFREDPERHIVLASVTPEGKDAVFGEMREQLKTSSAKEAFVFVHGFNVPFQDAAMRTAQIAYDMNFDGVPILYSWPSRASVLSYIADTAVVNLSGRRLARVLEDVVKQSGATRIHLIAHSMGNRALTDALELYALRHKDEAPAFDQVLFTAPDLDAGLFAEMAATMRLAARRLTLYASNKDWALAVSRKLHGDAPRAGQGGKDIVHVGAVDAIDMTDLGEDMLQHGYFADNSSALTDILSLFWRDAPPEQRCGMAAETGTFGGYWRYTPNVCDSDALLSTLAILRKGGVSTVVDARNFMRRFILPVDVDPAERSRLDGALAKLLGD